MKVIRELGSDRRETGWSLSAMGVWSVVLVCNNREEPTSGMPIAALGSYSRERITKRAAISKISFPYESCGRAPR